MLEAALDRVLEHTGALAGEIRVGGPEGRPLAVRRPGDLGDSVGMQWAHRILDDAPASVPQPAQFQKPDVDAAIVDLPLAERVATAGTMRLVFHPSADPAISMSALADIAEKIGTAAALATSLADLRREEHQRTALYGVALQLTGRAELRELLDLITKHARELLGAERAVACLADPRTDGHSVDWTDRMAIADDGTTCSWPTRPTRAAPIATTPPARPARRANGRPSSRARSTGGRLPRRALRHARERRLLH